jgi:glyoxylase-like metal-dependent hydrolase (beta-lactamase superfamily II)
VRSALPLAVLAALVPAAPAAAQGRSALDRAVRAVGGEDALQDLRSYSYRASGEVSVFNEGVTPGGPPGRAATFTSTVRQRIAGRDALRIASRRNSRGTPRPVTEVINGSRGSISGQYANFGAPLDDAAMTPDRRAAILREQQLLNPHLLLRAALASPRGVRSARGGTLVLRNAVAPIRLRLVGGRISSLSTQEHDYQRRTVDVRVVYRRWRRAGRLRLPTRVTMTVDGFAMHVERRRALRANPSFGSGTFAVGAQQAPADRSLAARGARTSRWLQSFAALGFPKDGSYATISEKVLAPGVVLLDGVSNYSLIVERSSGIVVLDSSVHDLRAETVIDHVERRFPGKPITHIVSLHHHADHNSGMRPYVARGARAVVHEAAAAHFRRVFADRGSRILPDALDRTDRPAQVDVVPANGRLTLPDATRPINVYAEPTTHAADTVFAHMPDTGVLFVNGDTYSPGSAPGEGGAALNRQIVANGLNVTQIAGAHGRPVTYAEFASQLSG